MPFRWIPGRGRRIGRRMWGFVIVLGILAVVTGGARGAVGAEREEGVGWFGLTRLVDLHLEIPGEEWDRMGSAGGPAERRSGGAEPGMLEMLRRRFFGGAEPVKGPGPGDGARSAAGYPWGVCVVRCEGRELTRVGVRFKGASSMVRAPNAHKRPFKLDFGRGHPGRRFLGVEELSLGNNVNDATQMREALAYEVFRRAGVPAPRTGFARVTLTIPGRLENRLLGLYTLVEAVDREFEQRWFGGRGGLWMKPERMAGLAYLGGDWGAYRDRYRPDEPKGGTPPDQAAAVIEFARWLRDTEPGEFGNGLGGWLDPDAFARFVAVNAILANVDSFLGNGHNYYLHLRLDAGTRRFTFVPWDLNEAFGVHPVSGPSGTQLRFSVLRPNGDPNLLVEKFVADPRFGAAYRKLCAELLEEVFDPARLAADIDRIAAVTAPVVRAESRRAWQEFEHTVLGTGGLGASVSTQPRHDREWAADGYRPWGFPPGVEIDHLPLKAWIAGREAQVREELEGRTRGLRPRPRL